MNRDAKYLVWVKQGDLEFWELASWHMDQHYFMFDRMSQSGGKRKVLKYFELPNGVIDLILNVHGSWNNTDDDDGEVVNF